ncbi:MAG: RNA pyrophosphohydrolase [Shimia sp.]
MTPDQIAALPYRQNVGIVLANAAGHVFTGARLDRPPGAPEAWQMPQGGIDPGESPRDAAFRELQEETGVPPSLVTLEAETVAWVTYDLPTELVPTLWGGKWRGQRQKWFLMRFHGTDADIDIDLEHREFSAWRWSSPEELVANIVPFKRAVYQAVLDELGPHL